jgi:hypothetical protein
MSSDRTRDEAWAIQVATAEQGTGAALGRWGHSEHEKAERWSGAFESREEAIEDGRRHYRHGPAAPFWIQAGATPDAASFVPSADEIVEQMGNAAADNAGEVAAEYPDVSAEAREELDAYLATWATKHAAPRFWIAVGAPEKIEPLPLGMYYEPNAEEYVIAYDLADAQEVYLATGAEPIESGMAWERFDDAKIMKGGEGFEELAGKTCAEWCAKLGRGYLGSGNC